MNDFAPRPIALMCTWNDWNLGGNLFTSLNAQFIDCANCALKPNTGIRYDSKFVAELNRNIFY